MESQTIADWLRAEGEKVGLQKGVQQGMQQGMQQGIEQTRIKTAARLLEQGFDYSFIHNITDLSFEEINSLKGP